MNTGEKIVYQRKKHCITQEDLANKIGVSRQTISKWESNLAVPDTESILRLADLFDVSTDYLIKEAVQEKETVSKKKNYSLALGLYIGFVALVGLSVVIGLLVAYKGFNVPNGLITFFSLWGVGLVGSIISLTTYRANCEYSQGDQKFLRIATSILLLLSLSSLGVMIALPISDVMAAQLDGHAINTGVSIVSTDFYIPWAYVGGNLGLALALLLVPFIMTRGENFLDKKVINLYLSSWLAALFLLFTMAGYYYSLYYLNYRCIISIIMLVIAAGLVVLLCAKRAFSLRQILLVSILAFFSFAALIVDNWARIEYSNYSSATYDICACVGFILLAIYLLIEGIIALKKQDNSTFMLGFVLYTGMLIISSISLILSTTESTHLMEMGVNIFFGYFLVLLSLVPTFIAMANHEKSAPKLPKPANN